MEITLSNVFNYMFSDDNDWGNPTYYVVKTGDCYVKKVDSRYTVRETTSKKIGSFWCWKNVALHICDLHSSYYDKIKIVKIHWWNMLWWWLKMEDRDSFLD